VNMFFYQTMDALDGKQARRTGSSSPLGELFDHGCDAVTTVLTNLTVAGAILMGPTHFTFFFFFSTITPFYLKQIEEYHTGEMILGYANVTEAQFVSISSFLVSAIFGPEMWHRQFQVFGFNFTILLIALICLWISTGFTVLSSVVAVVKFYFLSAEEQKKQNPMSNQHHLSLGRAALQTMPILSAILCSLWWSYLSPHLINEDLQYFYIAIGLSVAAIVGKLVVARVCHQHFSSFQVLLLPLYFGILNTLLGGLDDSVYIKVYAFVAAAAYLHFALSIIYDFTNFLGIRCFSITNNAAQQQVSVQQ